jgi:hypothetical protein
MDAQNLADLFVPSVAVSLAVVGIAKIAALRPLRQLYRRLDYPAAYGPVTGFLQLTAAALLCFPGYRLIGAALAGGVLFLSIIGLLSNREYRWAALGIALLGGIWASVLVAA